MSILPLSPLTPMLRKLQRWAALSDPDRAALLDLPHKIRHLAPNQFIVHEGEKAGYSCVLLSGFAVRHKVAGNGGRQILSLHMAGDLVDLQNSLLDVADHNVQAIGRVEAAYIPVEAITALAADHPAVGRAMWRETLVEGSIFRESLLNLGRRDARARTAHFLCEMALRLEAAGLAVRERFELPVTQEQMGDMLGLTSVHVNRTLQSLGADGIIDRRQRDVAIHDWDRLAKTGDFDPAYLHLGGAVPAQTGAAALYGRETVRPDAA
ncbi:Crp/Fnr family transcriptional regulator [Sphingomonas bacterium]|uniref:Crp/Fnr family transcriptional regulator n=1 Tax=Sphingomonas bacterium TaxID=1895847 RepID=UPI002611AA69|nr:Crp/Fnr family transcriptional regulator [Sphingomonas bacterium]MDB5677094.1 Crp/Fnr family transcriptional regulator [Sphingomonas bacterium]